MHAVKPNPYMLVDFDRYGWSEREPHVSESARRRAVVNGFLQARKYWRVIDFLTKGAPFVRPFWTMGEAVEHFGAELRKEHSEATLNEVRMRYVVARYFRAAGWGWL